MCWLPEDRGLKPTAMVEPSLCDTRIGMGNRFPSLRDAWIRCVGECVSIKPPHHDTRRPVPVAKRPLNR
ncbi:MAG: hypothetical protein HOI65_12165 [Opitutae bacterium]|nr:hypothetical protein [Opitutae bacterium]